MNHIIAISGGKDSTALALMLKERNPDTRYRYVITPTGDELPDMVEHWRKIECLLGAPLERVTDLTLRQLVRQHKMLPNFRARFCTVTIKIKRFQKWLLDHTPAVVYVGLRADEQDREGGIYDIDGVSLAYPLREAGWDKAQVIGYLRDLGVDIPKRTDCARCFWQTLSEWWRLWKDHPAIFEDAVQDEIWVTEARGKPCTYRSEGRDTWPASLADLRKEFDRGRIPKNRRGIPANQLEMDMDDEREAMCSFCAR